VSRFAAFVVLRFFVGQAHSITGRGSPTFTVLGYGLIIVAGAVMLFHSFGRHRLVTTVLTGGIVPCPLTISVLGFAWVQGTAIMVMVVLAGLALGIATTIGIVAVVTILARHTLRQALAQRLPQLERAPPATHRLKTTVANRATSRGFFLYGDPHLLYFDE
jgi:nickel/cobalt exporter